MDYTNKDIKLIIDKLENNLDNIEKFEEIKYFDSYFEFLKYFENINTIDYHSLVISSYFTYGWMPTILKNFNTESKILEALNIFNNVKNNIDINEEEYLTLVFCINGSIVGVSKLLHFINPQQYPIYDSRIKNYFRSNNLLKSLHKATYQTKDKKDKDVTQYNIYRNVCLEIIKNDRFEKIYNKSIQKLGINNPLTKMRVLENLFFTFGKQ